MPDLSIITITYGQPDLLNRFLAEIPLDPKIELVVVDDCGDPPAEKRPSIDQLFRIDEDIPWNQPGARNLGIVHAKAPVLLIVDNDMRPQAFQTAQWLAAARTLKENHVIIPAVRYPSGELNLSHPHNYLIRRDDMVRMGGYDEDYAGAYGWEDVQQINLFMMMFEVRHAAELFIDHHGGGVEKLERNTSRNQRLHLRKARDIETIGAHKWCSERKGSNLRFRWHQVH
jgi:Predicted glycosyltransferases